MGIIKPTCPPPPPPRDITAATRESVIVPSLPAPSVLCRPDLFASFAIRDRRDGRAVRARRVARGTNARERVGPGLHRINPRPEERENGGNRASEPGKPVVFLV